MVVVPLWHWQFGRSGNAGLQELDKTPVAFSNLNGWLDDDHAAAFAAFRASCEMLRDQIEQDTPSSIVTICSEALALSPAVTSDKARRFFETFFTPYLIARPQQGALVTGYFEPELDGALEPGGHCRIPVYALPDDLVRISENTKHKGLPDDLTAARVTSDGPVPYFTRQDIEQGALSGRGLEIAYLADPYDAYVMQVQGSGRIKLPSGRFMRIAFSGKNGHPYTSIGKVLIERGALDAENATLENVLAWLRAHPQDGQAVMWQNKSYPFFRRLDDGEASSGPLGSMQVPLIPGRSLAVDPRYHRLGLPIWVMAPGLDDDKGNSFQRLMVAQDSGSAIRGPVRGDIFWGSGEQAGCRAGNTKHICDFVVLIPN